MRAVSVYEYWSPGDWIEHYAGARFDPRWAAYGSLWDRQGRSLPMYQAGQTLAFNGERLSEAREFPLGFYEAAVPPVCTPGTAAAGPGTTNIVTAPLYGPTGSLFGTTLDVAINGAAPVIVSFVGGVASEVALLAAINAVIEPEATASLDATTDTLLITTSETGSGASLGFSASAAGVLGLPAIPVSGTDPAPGVKSIAITSSSQLRGGFRGERLVIPSDIAPNFAVYDIKIGNRSQLANSVALPAETFVEGAVGVRLSLATAVVAMDVAIVVANLTKTPQDFRGALIGTAFL